MMKYVMSAPTPKLLTVKCAMARQTILTTLLALDKRVNELLK